MNVVEMVRKEDKMKNFKRHAKFYLAILFATVLVFGTVGVAMAGNLEVDDAGGNEDEIIYGS